MKPISKDVMPPPFLGVAPIPNGWEEITWLNDLPKNTFFALWARFSGPESPSLTVLPTGHPLYVISFHQEHFNLDWIIEQSNKIDAPIIVLNDGSCYDYPFKSNVHFFNYYSWHHHMNQMMSWHPHRRPRRLKYKISAITNRISQNKLYIFTALIENHSREDLLIKLGTWLEEKNVHHRVPTGVTELDDLSDTFFNKYYGQIIEIDDFNNEKDNNQQINSNPWQPIYLESAIHFTNESYHYSLMHDAQRGSYIRPGPQYSEKTYKCLIAGTPFIAVSQFESYKYFSDLGFKFDYGEIDLSWDNDPGNLSRLCSLVKLAKSLKNYTIEDIDLMTKDSTEHNTHHLWSGEFNRQCRLHNDRVKNEILSKFK